MHNMIAYLNKNITEKMALTDIIDTFEKACLPMDEEDMILFETGTFGFTGEDLFYFSLVKQIPDDYDNEYYQCHVDILYKPDSENKQFNTTIWNEDSDENIFDYIRNSKEFLYAKNKDYIRIEIYMEET